MDGEFSYVTKAKAASLGVEVETIFQALAAKRVSGEFCDDDDPTEIVLQLTEADIGIK
ncbi:hypothetical protein [Photobacterium kishitanii]|uniref:hypothetical protein n=1 Tax=Photobacterium kishitanii TaxID=318456 RepID=UPI000B09E49B|nr:hypothetical protein [Photobacterium kishitanii]